MNANSSARIPGGKFLTEDGRAEMEKARKRAKAKERREKTARQRSRALTVVGAVLCDGVLVYMVTNSLIDQLFGVLFIAGASAIIGYNMK